MLLIACNSREVIEAEPCEPQYSPILDKMVAAGVLEVRIVDERGRIGARVADPHGDPLWVPVDTDPMDLRFVLPGPGRYAVVARDHQGRHLGRNDIFAHETGRPDPFRAPTAHERLKDELARERAQRAAAEHAAEAERKRRLEAEEQTRAVLANLEKANREIGALGRRLEARRREVDREQQRRREAERARAEAEKARAVAEQRTTEQPQAGLSKKDLINIAMLVVGVGYYLKRRLDQKESGASAAAEGAEKPNRAANATSKRGAARRAKKRRATEQQPAAAARGP